VGRRVAPRRASRLAGKPLSARPLLLASTSPQRPAILAQLGIPFEVVPPRYEERDDEGIAPVEAVRAHAAGKARSVARSVGERPVLGVDTTVVLDGASFGKPADEADAASMLARLAGRTHEVVSGLCLIAADDETVAHEVTRVTFRPVSEREIGAYVATGEWGGRAGGYAIQGRGASLVQRIEGDYLNVVGLPAALLVSLLASRYPGMYGFGG
jgi:septum formation protein